MDSLKGAGWILVFLLTGFILTPHEGEGAPSPYFGYSDEEALSDSGRNAEPENLQTALLGGEWIGSRNGANRQRVLLLSWQSDFILKSPTSFMNIAVETDGGRLTLEFPEAVNPYIALIAEYPYFYRLSDETDQLTMTRFRGLGAGAGIMKRTRELNVRLGAERVSGKLDGDVKESGRKMMEFVQIEQDRTRRTKLDEPTEGTRLFASLSTGQFRGFRSEPGKTVVTVQGAEEWYHPLSETMTFGLIAREGSDSRSGRFWKTTLGSFQEDGFNVPLPGYLYQQFAAKEFIEGEAGFGFRPTPDWSLYLRYNAAGGWSPHLFASVSAGATYLLFHKLPLNLQGAWGFSPSGAAEVLGGTALQW
ncbi:MAG: hypothetical protein HY204_05535 [Nitrospirae bacterium]|nr:hypothetical protein [Nitrospirota bacterium]